MLRQVNRKWTKTITDWYPRDGKRSKRRQPKRWEDDLRRTAGPEWMRIARDRNKWKSLEEDYVDGKARKGTDLHNKH